MEKKGEVSNRALASLLVAAIVVSLGGTIISLNRLGQMRVTVTGIPTGFATTTPNGTVTLSVQSALSITTSDDNAIDFGTCTPQAGSFSVVSSDTADSSVCSGLTSADSIAVRNNGNVNANVTVQINNTGTKHSGTFIPDAGSSSSYIAYKIANDGYGSYQGGCTGLQSSWKNFTSTSTKYKACDSLAAGPSSNSFLFYAQIGLPSDASVAGSTAKVTFWAQQV